MVHCFKTAGLYQCNLKFLLEITSYSLGGYFKELWTTSDSGEYVKILQETELVYVLAAINLYGEKKKGGGGREGRRGSKIDLPIGVIQFMLDVMKTMLLIWTKTWLYYTAMKQRSNIICQAIFLFWPYEVTTR